jgi:hypothetical protein
MQVNICPPVDEAGDLHFSVLTFLRLARALEPLSWYRYVFTIRRHVCMYHPQMVCMCVGMDGCVPFGRMCALKEDA